MSDEFKKHEGKGKVHAGSARTSPYPVSRLASTIDLVDVAKQISQADQLVNTKVSAKLQVIADQISALQEEAKKVLAQARDDQELHRAHCNFKRIPGKVYHLYEKADGSLHFLMLGPQEWGGAPPYKFIASYRLESDMSWCNVDEIRDEEENTRELVMKLLSEKGLL